MNPKGENPQSCSILAQIDLVCDRFEIAWRSGTAPDLAAYVLEIGESSRPLALRELLRVELELRRAHGDSPTLDEYVRRYPEHATILASVIQSADCHELNSIDTPCRNSGRGRLANDLAGVDLPNRVWPEFGPPSSVVKESSPPSILGGFHLIRELGSGGMGLVYEAEQLSMGRRVALKVLPFAALGQDKSLQRFRNEVRAAAALDHPHIVSIYSVGEDRGVHFFAMQLIRGQSLADTIAQLRNAKQVKSQTAHSLIDNALPSVDGQQADKQATLHGPTINSAVGTSPSTKRLSGYMH